MFPWWLGSRRRNWPRTSRRWRTPVVLAVVAVGAILAFTALFQQDLPASRRGFIRIPPLVAAEFHLPRMVEEHHPAKPALFAGLHQPSRLARTTIREVEVHRDVAVAGGVEGGSERLGIRCRLGADRAHLHAVRAGVDADDQPAVLLRPCACDWVTLSRWACSAPTCLLAAASGTARPTMQPDQDRPSCCSKQPARRARPRPSCGPGTAPSRRGRDRIAPTFVRKRSSAPTAWCGRATRASGRRPRAAARVRSRSRRRAACRTRGADERV